YPDDPAAKLFSTLRLNVTLIEPRGRQTIRMVLFPDGRPAEWKWEGAPEQTHPLPPPESILADFVGSSPGQFIPAGTSGDDAQLYAWNWRADQRFPLLAAVKM